MFGFEKKTILRLRTSSLDTSPFDPDSRLEDSSTTFPETMPRKPIVGGNWKCNPAEAAKLAGLIDNVRIHTPIASLDSPTRGSRSAHASGPLIVSDKPRGSPPPGSPPRRSCAACAA